LKKPVLTFIILAAIIVSSSADEWDIFEDPAFEIEKDIPLQKAFLDSIEFLFVSRSEADVGLSSGPEISESSRMHSRISLQCSLARNRFAMDFDGGVHAAIGIPGGKPDPLSAGIDEAVVTLRPFEGFLLRGGKMDISLGNSLYLNPADFLSQYKGDPRYPGRTGLPAIEAIMLKGRSRFSFIHIPNPGSYSIFSAHSPIGNASTVFRIFFESREKWKDPFYYTGICAELQLPLGRNASFSSQACVTDGIERYRLEEAGTAPDRHYVISTDRKRGEFSPRWSATGDFVLFSFLQFSIGYQYNGSGLKDNDISRLIAGESTGESSVDSFFVYPNPYIRNILFTSIGIPRLTDNTGIQIFALTSTLDGSSRITGMLFMTIGNYWSFDISAIITAGRKDSLFRETYEDGHIVLSAEYTF
jgi:hypothetical protein